jgi:hypothetical protein
MIVLSGKVIAKTLLKEAIPMIIGATIAIVVATIAYPFMLLLALSTSVVFRTKFEPVICYECWVEPFWLIFSQISGFLTNPWKFFLKNAV